MRQKAEANLHSLLNSFSVPVARPQWSRWLSENINEFRALMRTVTSSRREGNVRLRARPDLPAPLRRIQPEPDQRSCDTDWAVLLANRTGWHGVQTQAGIVLVFLLLLQGRTFFIDARSYAATGAPKCVLDRSFHVVGRVHELPHLEDLLLEHLQLSHEIQLG